MTNIFKLKKLFLSLFLVGLVLFVTNINTVTIKEVMTEPNAPEIKHHLSGFLGSFPPLVFHNKLDLSDKNITSLEGLSEIEDIDTVTYIDLSGNKLDRLEENSFAACPKLRILNLSNNRLTDLSRNTFRNVQLHALYISGNDIPGSNSKFVRTYLSNNFHFAYEQDDINFQQRGILVFKTEEQEENEKSRLIDIISKLEGELINTINSYPVLDPVILEIHHNLVDIFSKDKNYYKAKYQSLLDSLIILKEHKLYLNDLFDMSAKDLKDVDGNNMLHLASTNENKDPLVIKHLVNQFPHLVTQKNKFGLAPDISSILKD